MISTPAVFASVLALSVTAKPLNFRSSNDAKITLPFAMDLNMSSLKLPELDRSRAVHLYNRGKEMDHISARDGDATVAHQLRRRASSFNVDNTAVSYVANVQVGTPATTYQLLIDTGSSNTWIGAKKQYSPTNSSKSTGNQMFVSYGSGNVTGVEYTDTVALSSDLVITEQSIGVATSQNGFNDVDGILGIGPVSNTKGTVNGTTTVPTVTDNLYTQKKISTEVIGISYNPITSGSSDQTNGQLTFGGDDSSKYTGSITYAPITKSSPAKNYWGVDQSISYGSSGSNVMSSTSGILDTGTTLVLLQTDAFNRYKSLVGATVDNKTQLLTISSDQYAKLESLYFNIGNTNWELIPNAQVWPRALNTAIGGSSDNIYLIVSDLGQIGGKGLDFINGYAFLERFYSVYDTTNNRVGLANTENTQKKFE